jgi:cytochrome c peroxidase
MSKKTWIIAFLSVFVLGFDQINITIVNTPQYFPKPVYSFSKNKLNEAGILLGRALFYDPILSGNNSISCASCHNSYAAFTHVDHHLSHGIDDRIGSRNAPALMNLAWQPIFMWDGAINHLEIQALAPISNADEMGSSIAEVVSKLKNSKLYPRLYYAVYGDSTITGAQTLKAIAQFLASIVSANSKYDKVMRHEMQFNAQEKNGFALFQKHCNQCHTAPLFSNFQFENNGLSVDTALKDWGRMRITQNPKDSLKFKVPTLRNIEYSYPYMHDGRFKQLSEVLNHYTHAKKQTSTLAVSLKKPIPLSANDKVDIIAFLLTLSDKDFIFNPRYTYPKDLFFPQTKD